MELRINRVRINRARPVSVINGVKGKMGKTIEGGGGVLEIYIKVHYHELDLSKVKF